MNNDSGYRATRRDRVAHRLANAALLLATPTYRRLIGGSVRYGMAAAVRDVAEGRPSPVKPVLSTEGWDA